MCQQDTPPSVRRATDPPRRPSPPPPLQHVDARMLHNSSPVTSERLSASPRPPWRTSFTASSDSPLSSSTGTRTTQLPRCAVVNFRRDGNVLRWTPRARENTGGMAARVKDFDDAFQLEELSSRTFGFSMRNVHRDDIDSYPFIAHDVARATDLSFAIVAAASAGMEAPPPRHRHPFRRITNIFRGRNRSPDRRAPIRIRSHNPSGVALPPDIARRALSARVKYPSRFDHVAPPPPPSRPPLPPRCHKERRSLSTGDIHVIRAPHASQPIVTTRTSPARKARANLGCVPRTRQSTMNRRTRPSLRNMFRRRTEMHQLVDPDRAVDGALPEQENPQTVQHDGRKSGAKRSVKLHRVAGQREERFDDAYLLFMQDR